MDNDNRSPIVVVEDDPDTLDCVCDLLGQMGFVTAGVQDSRVAQAFIAEARPRLVILDVEMPGVDGITLFEQLRSDERTRELPVIFFTSSEDRVRRRLVDFRARGITVVSKPNVQALQAAVQRVLVAAEAA